MSKWCFNYESGEYEYIDRDGFSIDRGEYVYNWDDSEYEREERERDRDGIIDGIHRTRVDGAHFFFKPAFVDGSHLLEQHDAVL